MFEFYRVFLKSFFEWYRTNNYNYVFTHKSGKNIIKYHSKSLLKEQIIKSRETKKRIVKSLNKCISKKQRDWRIHLIREINVSIERRKNLLK